MKQSQFNYLLIIINFDKVDQSNIEFDISKYHQQMNQKNRIDSSVLIKNILIDQVEGDNYQEFKKKKCTQSRQNIKPFCDVTNTKVKQTKVFNKLEPLKNKIENQTISINYQYADDFNDQQNNQVQLEQNLHIQSEITNQLSKTNQLRISQGDESVHINPNDDRKNTNCYLDIKDNNFHYHTNQIRNVTPDKKQLKDDDNDIKCISNQQKSYLAQVKSIKNKKLCLQFDKQDSSSIEQSSSQKQQSSSQNQKYNKQNVQNLQKKIHISLVLKKFENQHATQIQKKPKQHINFEQVKDIHSLQQNKPTQIKNICLTNFCNQESDSSDEDQLTPKQSCKFKQINKESQVRRRKKIFLKVFGDEGLSDQEDQESSQIPQRNVLLNENQSSKKDILFDDDQSLDSDQSNVQILKPINIAQFVRLNPDNFYQIPITDGYIFQTIVKRYVHHPQQIVYQMFDSTTYKKVLFVKRCSKGFQIYFSNEIRFNSKRIDEQTQNQCALLTSNFFGTQFNCFKCKQTPKDQLMLNKLNRLMTIQYESNIFGLNGPRKMQIFIPNYEYIIKGNKNLHEVHRMEKQKQQSNTEQNRVQKFINKTPKWNNQISAFVLNFNGRANISSVKNFIITKDKSTQHEQQKCEESFPNYILFGKIQKHVFNLDIKFPFTIVQSMALALSSFDKKFGCQ